MAALRNSVQDSDMGAYFKGKWLAAHEACLEKLNDSDRRYLDDIGTCEAFKDLIPQLQDGFASVATGSLLNRLTPFINSLRSFLALIAVSTGSTPFETAMIWGIISLVVQVTSRMPPIFTETMDMLDNLGHDLEILEIYERVFENNLNMGKALVGIFVEIIDFWTTAIHFFRRNNSQVIALQFWPSVKNDFEKVSKRIKQSCAHAKEKATAMTVADLPASTAKLLSEMQLDEAHISTHGIQTQRTTDTTGTSAPCYEIPFSRNRKFRNRETELAVVHSHLCLDGQNPSINSFALWGTGGVGKTQIALEYAYQRVDAGRESVLWVNCETGLSVARSFTQIAKALKLHGVMDDENSDKNRHLVLTWFRSTDSPWLLVLDNVEDDNLARESWPIALHSAGSILVTSRRSIMAVDPAAAGAHIREFSVLAGADMMLYLVDQFPYSETEIKAAKSLSEMLGGLVLALTVMSAQIRTKRWNFTRFLAYYERNASKLHSDRRGIQSHYQGSLRTCWYSAFENLSEPAGIFLGVLSFTGPDNIPQEIFEVFTCGSSSSRLALSVDEEDGIEDVLEELIDTSLINREPETQMLSVHRLIQFEYRDYIGASGRLRSFLMTSEQLYYKFPKQINGVSLRNEWVECKKYAQHILMLCAHWQRYRFVKVDSSGFDLFTKSLANCAWYLLESGAWSEEIELMNTAFEVCEDKYGVDYAHLCNTHSCVQVERGKADEAIHLLDKAIAIRTKVLGPTHVETAHSYSNYGNSVQQAYKSPESIKEALSYYLKAIEIDNLQPPEDTIKLSYIRHLNISRAYRLLGQYENGLSHLKLAEESVIFMFKTLDTFFGATLRVHSANILFDQGKIGEAERQWWEAYEIFNKENNTHPATISVRLKLACLQMRRGELENTLKVLQRLLILCELREKAKGDKGEIARVTRRLAEAHLLKGNFDEAISLTEQAEGMRMEIQKHRQWQLPDEERSYDILVWNEYW